jgi:hypothetical protein
MGEQVVLLAPSRLRLCLCLRLWLRLYLSLRLALQLRLVLLLATAIVFRASQTYFRAHLVDTTDSSDPPLHLQLVSPRQQMTRQGLKHRLRH